MIATGGRRAESGLLVQPFDLSVQSYRYDLVYSPRAAERPATRVLRDWVQREFGVKSASGKPTT